MKATFLLFFAIFFSSMFAQEPDLLSLMDDTDSKNEKVFATFKTSKIINGQSIETVKKRCLDFRITHRFDNIAVNGSAHTMWGIDNSQDIRFSFDYGITNNLTVGFSRSKFNELLELYSKYRFLEQTVNNKIPVSIAAYFCAAYSPITSSAFYLGVDKNTKQNDLHRLNYFSQILIARKFNSWLSLQIMPSYHHRNFIKYAVNTTNNKEDQHDIFSLGIGGRLRFTKRMALIVDYFYNFSDYRNNNKTNPFNNPLAIGLEMETGGHVFHVNFTNNGAISENNFIPNTTSDWLKGEFKLGFNISRVFTF
jgi:hypothetical protein